MDEQIPVRVLAGDPTPEELAALVAVLAGRAAGTAGAPGAEPDDVEELNAWTPPVPSRGPAAALGRPGTHAWRTSYWPC